MSSIKLFQLLSIFGAEEMRALRVFISSPFFNQSTVLVDLFDYVRAYHPEYQSRDLGKREVFQSLNRTVPFSDKFINDRFSDLTKLVEEFLIVQQMKNDQELRGQALRRNLIKHNQYELFSKKIKKEISVREKKVNNGWRYFYDLWELHFELFKHPQTPKWDMKGDASKEMIGYLDEAYLIIKLRYGFHNRMRQSIFKPEGSDELLEKLIELSKGHENPVVQFYNLFLEYFAVSDVEEHWHKIKEYYFQNYKELPLEEKKAGLLGLINKGFKVVLKSQHDFFKQIFELYQFGLETKLLIEDGCIRELTFKNIALIGSGLREIKWTKAFIKKYQHNLPKGYDPNILYISQAYLAFYNREFEKSMEWLNKNERMNAREKNNFKSLFVRCLYEQYCIDPSYEELLASYIGSYTKFLQRRKKEQSADKVTAYLNFVYLVKRMKEVRYLPKKERSIETRKISQEIEKRKTMIAKSWILEKVEEMESAI